jgi:hypothetical protein
MEETRLGGMIVKWQNGTDRQMKKGPRRPSPSASLRYRGVIPDDEMHPKW